MKTFTSARLLPTRAIRAHKEWRYLDYEFQTLTYTGHSAGASAGFRALTDDYLDALERQYLAYMNEPTDKVDMNTAA